MQTHLANGAKIDYITISRELGSGGAEIARQLSELMNWQLYDKEILDHMADNMDVQVKVLESVDEKTVSWMNDWMSSLFSTTGEHVELLSYYKHLGKVLMVIAKHGKAIIVGRAAGQILPRDKGLSVRVTAPFKLRCKRYAEQNNISFEKAIPIVKKADDIQKKFVKNFLGKNINNSKYYDMVFNTEKLSLTSVTKLISRSLDQRIASEKDYSKVKAMGLDVAHIVEHQVEQWEKSPEVDIDSEIHAHLAGGAEVNYITISRELGSGGVEIARMLSDLMKWQLYDKEILDYMADNMKVHTRMLMSVDERTLGWIGNRLVRTFSGKSIEHLKWRYYEHLGESLLVIAMHGRAILVGRGACQMLPREKGLSIHVTAPFELRCRRYAKQNNIGIEKARSVVKKADRAQAKFVKSFSGKDILDSKYYDIVCNTEKLSPVSVAKLIWRAFEQRVVNEGEKEAKPTE